MTKDKATAIRDKELPAKCGWYFMRYENQEPLKEGLVVWVGHNKSGVRHEGQFFYADSSFLRRREFLGPITPDVFAEVAQLREAAQAALTYLVDTGESCRTVGLIDQLRAALALKENR